jgi:hypothetical protein
VSDDGSPEPPVEAGEVLRPEAVVLGDEALVPGSNLITPPPNVFTHQIVADEPYRFDGSPAGGPPDGILAAGTPVVVLVESGDRRRVADGTGLYVDVRRTNLQALPDR